MHENENKTATVSPLAHERIPCSSGAHASGFGCNGDDSESEDTLDGSRKRKRPLNVTCEACKQRKVKCDRAQPSCGWCTRNEFVCEYKERKKPGLRAGYGRELEARLDSLEAIVQKQNRQLAAHLAETCSSWGSLGRSDTFGSAQEQQSFHQKDGSLSTRAGDEQYRQPGNDIGKTPTVAGTSLIQVDRETHASADFLSTRSQDAFAYPMHAQPEMSLHARTGSFLIDSAEELPPPDLLYNLIDLYFDHVNTWLPLLDKKTTLETLFNVTPRSEADQILLHAIIATALRFTNDLRLTSDLRQHYYDLSKQKVQLYGLENSNIRALQALVILALDVTGTTNGPPGWNLLALISRSTVQLGLAIESTSNLSAPIYPSIATLRASVLPESRTFVEDEERRRLFWAVYLLDRYATIATAFEFALDEKEVDRRLPCRDDLFGLGRPVETRWYRPAMKQRYSATKTDMHGHFSYHCELLGILGRIHQFLKRPVDIASLSDVEQWQGSYRSLDSELNAWHFSLPDEFANIARLARSCTSDKSASCGWIMLYSAYCLTTIRLNSSAAYPSQTSAIFSSSYSAMQRCLSAVENMRQLCRFVRASGLLDKFGPPFAFSAWVCARVMLVHGSTTDHKIDPDIDFFVSLLSEQGRYWGVAQRYSEILDRVLVEYRESQRKSNMPNEQAMPSTVRILGDMRRCAYDLDILISQQPHSNSKSSLPTRTNTPAPYQLEYLDVFDLFNFPRIPQLPDDNNNGADVTMMPEPWQDMAVVNPTTNMPNFATPNPEADWLFRVP